jgi:two-component system catabolic regulation response regulator CreB
MDLTREPDQQSVLPASNAPVVLVVDDEPELAEAVAAALEEHGYETRLAASVGEARERLPGTDLVLLDLGLPDGDGLTWCGPFAEHAPLIVISARDGVVDRVAALEMGADDYLPKPFSTRELVARCRAVLRRSGAPRRRRAPIRVADLVIDADAFTVVRGDRLVPLTTKETELLLALVERRGVTLRRAELAATVWGSDVGFVNRSLEVHISSLRTKLGRRPDGSDDIVTVHGVGYRFRP